MQSEKLSLVALRNELGLSQKQLSRYCGIDHNTIVRCEKSYERGKKINYSTARSILAAINYYRLQRGAPQLRVNDIQWLVRGMEDPDLENG